MFQICSLYIQVIYYFTSYLEECVTQISKLNFCWQESGYYYYYYFLNFLLLLLQLFIIIIKIIYYYF